MSLPNSLSLRCWDFLGFVSHYEHLGLARTATSDEIKKALEDAKDRVRQRKLDEMSLDLLEPSQRRIYDSRFARCEQMRESMFC